MISAVVKQETNDFVESSKKNRFLDVSKTSSLIEISTSSTSTGDSSGDSDVSAVGFRKQIKSETLSCINDGQERAPKKQKTGNLDILVPDNFLEPLRRVEPLTALSVPETIVQISRQIVAVQSCKQFWKAGDYEGGNGCDSGSYSGGMDHVRVHPKFLHSNATSHKWALGAFAELLDNSLDEVCNGATYVKVETLINKKDGNKMLLVEDDGGGMDPDKMRQCMSLGYSAKSKLANTIGQYGNGFKTSTMRLGADVIVFSRCKGKDGMSLTQSIGLLSYTFLRGTGKEDIVVPMVDYEKTERGWNRIIRTSPEDWDKNLETIVQWSPYVSEKDLIKQFDFVKGQGTRIVIFNLWEDDQGQSELDFDTDPHDIQISVVNRDQKNIEMAERYPNSRHYLTYRHSLRSYTSILYLRLPPGFRIILRGKDVEHHNLVKDMMLWEKITYKPMAVADETPKESNMVAIVTIGFVKDAKYHIDIQGFNVYHKNRLIKPFWRVWNAAGSDGRGVIGVLEANFVEPAHDKQGFERTTVLSRLEARLVVMQKQYWASNCHKIGYAPRRHSKKHASPDKESSESDGEEYSLRSNRKGHIHSTSGGKKKSSTNSVMATKRSPPAKDQRVTPDRPKTRANGSCCQKTLPASGGTQHGHSPSRTYQGTKGAVNGEDKERSQGSNDSTVAKLLNDLQFEKDRRKLIEAQLEEAQKKQREMDKEQEALIDIFQEERNRRDEEEAKMRKRLQDASTTIQDLREKVKLLENTKILSCKIER